jgi:hypothetical protein
MCTRPKLMAPFQMARDMDPVSGGLAARGVGRWFSSL